MDEADAIDGAAVLLAQSEIGGGRGGSEAAAASALPCGCGSCDIVPSAAVRHRRCHHPDVRHLHCLHFPSLPPLLLPPLLLLLLLLLPLLLLGRLLRRRRRRRHRRPVMMVPVLFPVLHVALLHRPVLSGAQYLLPRLRVHEPRRH